jgi:hypothetical protein
MQIPQDTTMNFAEKIAMLKAATPALLSVSVEASRFHVRFSETVREPVVTGQGGKVRWRADSTSEISLPILPEDTYLRVSYITKDGIRYHLNPVCRFQGVIGNRRSTQQL